MPWAHRDFFSGSRVGLAGLALGPQCCDRLQSTLGGSCLVMPGRPKRSLPKALMPIRHLPINVVGFGHSTRLPKHV